MEYLSSDHVTLGFFLGNSWGYDEEKPHGCIGCGAQEQFYACADIAITESDDDDHDDNDDDDDVDDDTETGDKTGDQTGDQTGDDTETDDDNTEPDGDMPADPTMPTVPGGEVLIRVATEPPVLTNPPNSPIPTPSKWPKVVKTLAKLVCKSK